MTPSRLYFVSLVNLELLIAVNQIDCSRSRLCLSQNRTWITTSAYLDNSCQITAVLAKILFFVMQHSYRDYTIRNAASSY